MHADLRTDLELTREQIQSLSSAEALAAFFAYLRYPGETRFPMTAEALGLSSDLAQSVRRIERLTSVEAGALEIYLCELKSVTVSNTRALARTFRDRAGNYLLVLTDDYDRLDFVLLERVLPETNGGGIGRRGITIRPRVLTVDRRNPGNVALRVLRRFTFTEFDLDDEPDPYAQYDKLQSAYTVAEWSEPLFNNRALFSDYYLNNRLPNLPEWDDPVRNQAFRVIRGLFANARQRFTGADGASFRQELVRPLLEVLGFRIESRNASDLQLFAGTNPRSVAFVLAYPWCRYLDGKDEARDTEHPEENPGVQVVSLLEAGKAPWAIVTNGKIWRLYSGRAHSRATNYYEIDLEETLALPDPAQAFRYFYLLFRAAAFTPMERLISGQPRKIGFLDWLVEESAIYAQELGERLKERVFEEIFPHFAEGFIQGLGGPQALLAQPEAERAARLDDVFQGTLSFLYRLLFLLYAESRDLLPVREVRGYYEISLQCLKEEISDRAAGLEDQSPQRLAGAYSKTDTALYDRLLELFRVIDRGDTARNVPIYNGGLFLTEPDPIDNSSETRNARFLLHAKLPDRYLALGLDRLARDLDPKRGDLTFIDYKSLGVRQLGSIYEGLLEFKVCLADQKMAVVKGKKTEEIIPHAEARRKKRVILTEGRGARARPRILSRGTVYLENDRRERKATGSYYTPDYIVQYIVRHTVGPALDEKLEALRPRLRQAEKRFRETVRRKQTVEKVTPDRSGLLINIAGDVLRDLFDIKVLDPAMGSGHFLVEAVDYITDRLVRFLDGFPFLGYFFEGMRRDILAEMERQGVTVDPGRLTDVTLLKRHVLKRCIYGVDLNRMAVELAKVSLWLDCFTLGAPLSFLDHHLRHGNSLIGAMARDVAATFESELPLFGGPFAGLLRAAEIMRGISFLTDVTLTEVRESEQLFREFDRAARPYKQMLDVYVARHFGVTRADEFLRLYGAEAIKAGSDTVGEPYATVLHETRRLYKEKQFFHWDLEFPEVFIDLERAAWKDEDGFDAVVGNPPYDVLAEKEREEDLSRLLRFFEEIPKFAPALGRKLDLYRLFVVLAFSVSRSRGKIGLIVPMSLLADQQTKNLRSFIINENAPLVLDAFPQKDDPKRRVFYEAKLPTCVVIVEQGVHDDYQTSLRVHPGKRVDEITGSVELSKTELQLCQRLFGGIPLVSNSTEIRLLLRLHTSPHFEDLGNVFETFQGEINATTHSAFLSEDSSVGPRVYRGGNVQRYEFIEEAKQGTVLYIQEKDFHSEHGGGKTEHIARKRFGYQRKAALDNWRRLIFCELPDPPCYCIESISYYLYEGRESYFMLSLLNCELLEWCFEMTSTNNMVSTSEIASLPLRKINFTTPQVERERLTVSLISRYEGGEHQVLLAEVEVLLPKNEAGRFLAFELSATGAEEKSDVVYDLLAYLARQMIDLNKQKQAEQKRFLTWLEAVLHVHPDKRGRTGLDALTGKTKVFGYLGDYQKGEPEAPWVVVEDVLFKNKRRLGISLNDTRLVVRLRAEYEKSLDTLRPIKAQLARTDRLIDQVVYRLYGLTEEEIMVVEGKPGETLRQPSAPSGGSIARESDPRVLAQIIEVLEQHGPSTTRQLSARLSERNVKLEPDKARTIQREFQFLGWLEPEASRWSLTRDGKALANTHPMARVDAFARRLALANEQHNQQVVSRLLQRMWDLNPSGQGAVILPQPPLGAVLDSLTTLRSLLVRQFPRWSQDLQQQMAGFVEPETFEPIIEVIVESLTSRWEEMRPHERRNRTLALITERFVELMFGHIMTASDVEIWQSRLDWAGLTHTARHLPGLAGQVWFPVGAFRPTGDDAFTPVEGLTSRGLTFYRYTPTGTGFQARFGDTLLEGYREQQRQERVEYVSLLAVRDWVCYRLRISHAIFESTLQDVFPRALRGELGFTIALEVDITPIERERLRKSRARAVVIDSVPRYIIAMRAKS